MELNLNEQELNRRNALVQMRELGIEPYPAAMYPVNATTEDIRERYNPEEGNFQDVAIAGRIMSRRIMGAAAFIELMDEEGRVQVYVKRDEICPGEDKTMYNTVFKKLLDIGDIIGIKGFAFVTQTGQKSVHAKELTVLSKSLRVLPIVKEKDGEVFDAFSDPELRYRQRYVDLIVNPQVREKISSTIHHLRGVETIYDKAVKEAVARVADAGGRTINIPALLGEVEPQTVLFELLRPYGFVSAQVEDVFRSLTGESGRRFANGGWEVLKDRDTLILRPRQSEAEEERIGISIPQPPVEVALTRESMLLVSRFPLAPDYRISRSPKVATLDASCVEFPLTVRPWRQGDKFAPFGMKGRKKLVSDLLTDLKLSRFEKEKQLVVTDARDRILWVVGRRTDERARVTEQTREVVEMIVSYVYRS